MKNFTMDTKNQSPEQDIHSLGLSYIYSHLDREGYTIYEVNTDPLHHFQFLARRGSDLIIVAVKTVNHPDIGTIDKSIEQKLIEESERLDAIPHVARMAVSPVETNDFEIDGVPGGTEYRVTFNGLTTL